MNYSRFIPVWLPGFLLLASAAAAVADAPAREATNLWLLQLNLHCNVSTPAIAPDRTIYQATWDGNLLAVTPAGQVRWTYKTASGTEIKSSPAIGDDGTIYFGSRDRHFYAVTPEGKLKWIFKTGGWVDSSPSIAADGAVLFGSWDKNFYALSPDGQKKWVFAVGAIVAGSPAIALDGTIYFGAFNKKLYALRPDGAVKWTFDTGGEIISSPAIGSDGTVYINAADGYLYAVKSDGTEKWHFHTGSYTEASPILDEHDNISIGGFVGEQAEDQFVINKDGKGSTYTGLACPSDLAAVAVQGEIYGTRPWRTFQANHTNGEVLWYVETKFNLSSSPTVGADGMIYFVCSHDLYAVRPPDGPLPPAKSSWPMFRGNARHTGRVGGEEPPAASGPGPSP